MVRSRAAVQSYEFHKQIALPDICSEAVWKVQDRRLILKQAVSKSFGVTLIDSCVRVKSTVADIWDINEAASSKISESHFSFILLLHDCSCEEAMLE
jgi:hypothetical protein